MTETNDLAQWIGKTETVTDVVTSGQAQALAATLDLEQTHWPDGSELPLMWNWIYCTQKVRQSELGPDGHPKKGGFLPPIALPRRMFAGARMELHAPLKVGAKIEKTSTVLDVVEKHGKSGRLAFVTVRHDYHCEGTHCLRDTHTIAYRETPKEKALPIKPTATGLDRPDWADWSIMVRPDPVLLFRYSALIFVSHRIHYDRDYTTQTEGYPGLLVHGPLIATMMAEFARMNLPGTLVDRFDFRAVAPIYDTEPFQIAMSKDRDAQGYRIESIRADGKTAMSGHIGLPRDA